MIGLGTLEGGALDESRGNAISADGSTIVGTSSTSEGSGPVAMRASGGTMQSLGDFPGGLFHADARGVSADGSVVVGFGNKSGNAAWSAFRYTDEAGLVDLGALGQVGLFSSQARGVSADGSVVVGNSGPVNAQGFGVPFAFRWNAQEGMVALGDIPGGGGGDAFGVSSDGNTIVGWGGSTSGQQAFRWTEATGTVGLGDLDGGVFKSQALDVSDDGRIVGIGSTADGARAFLWDEADGMRDLQIVLEQLGLDLSGWTLAEARAISNDGLTIVGVGLNPDGNGEAWIATLPEPGTGLLLGLALFGVAAKRRRAG